jgi:acyl-CoA thioester hydrolase
MTNLSTLEDFPSKTFDKVRYGDTDMQGHVNNAVFATFFETGRVDMMDKTSMLRRSASHHAVLARLTINYVAEVFWPGTVEIGTGVKTIGNSSVTYAQAVFQNGRCVAFGETVVVQVSKETGKATPLDDEMRNFLSGQMMTA